MSIYLRTLAKYIKEELAEFFLDTGIYLDSAGHFADHVVVYDKHHQQVMKIIHPRIYAGEDQNTIRVIKYKLDDGGILSITIDNRSIADPNIFDDVLEFIISHDNTEKWLRRGLTNQAAY